MKRITLALLTGVFLLTSLSVAADLAPVKLDKQLLVDDYVIESKTNITRELGKPRKEGGVIRPSVLTDFDEWLWHHEAGRIRAKLDKNGIPTVMRSDHMGYRISAWWNEPLQKFQMLYRAAKQNWTAYAESWDGYHWDKPIVTQGEKGHPFLNIPSNLVGLRGKVDSVFFEVGVTVDPTLPWGHPEKFKAAYNPMTSEMGAAMAYSPDAKNWKAYNNGISVTYRAPDAHHQVLWDHMKQKYILITREDFGDRGGTGEDRGIRIMTHKNNNLIEDPTAWETISIIGVNDPLKEKTPEGVAVMQIETMNLWIYEHIYFAVVRVLKVGKVTGKGAWHGEENVDLGDLAARPDADVVDSYLATSRDCINFDFTWIYDRKPFVERGGYGEFDKAKIMLASEPVNKDDKHWFYYSGDYNQHHAEMMGLPLQPVRDKIALATLPLDRYIAQAAGYEIGTITTKPFKVYSDELVVNLDAAGGKFMVEVLDENNKAIKGFTVKDSVPAKGVDQLRYKPQWKNNKNIASLKDKVVHLKFYLQNAKLYSFQIR